MLSASLSSATLVSPASRRHRRSLRFTTRRLKGAGRAGGGLVADWSEAGPAHRGIKPESARLRTAARALRDTRTHPGITFSREERTKRHERVRVCDKDTKRRRDAETQEERRLVCARVLKMDLDDKEVLSGEIVPVVIIGNGPSGICLSYLLSGYTPYLSPGASHPNPLLHSKLGEQPHLSLLEQDLEYLCEGLEGRSTNPMAVLFDSLLLPDSDFGLDYTSPLEWRFEPERAIPHLVLGKGPPGGAWHAMEGSMLTLSLANWMELPGLKLKDWMREKRRNVRNDRATPAEIASYYQHYVSQMSLEQSFACGTTVTSVTRQLSNQEGSPAYWRVTGLQRREGEELGDGSSVSDEVPFSLLAHNVVLATGTHDIPARLGVEGESLPFVCHSFWELEAAISSGELDQTSDAVLVVGAGLTAADAVLATHHLNTPVYHAFRRSVTDPGLIFNQLPKVLYPEYHKVHQMMTQQQHRPTPPPQDHAQNADSTPSSPPSSYSGYLSFPCHRVVAFRPDRKCILESESGQRTVVQVSKALVLIGAHPNLSFLEDNGRQLGVNTKEPITCRRNPIEVDPFTSKVVAAEGPGMYAMGPLVGENFVRFLKGGALAIASDLAKRLKEGGEGGDLATDTLMDKWLDRQTTTLTEAEACVVDS